MDVLGNRILQLTSNMILSGDVKGSSYDLRCINKFVSSVLVDIRLHGRIIDKKNFKRIFNEYILMFNETGPELSQLLIEFVGLM